MNYRNVAGSAPGRAPRHYTTDELEELIIKYGPVGTEYVDGMEPGIIVFDTTEARHKFWDGLQFVNLGEAGLPYPPPPITAEQLEFVLAMIVIVEVPRTVTTQPIQPY